MPTSKGNRRTPRGTDLGHASQLYRKTEGDGVGKSGMGSDEGVLMWGVRVAFN